MQPYLGRSYQINVNEKTPHIADEVTFLWTVFYSFNPGCANLQLCQVTYLA